MLNVHNDDELASTASTNDKSAVSRTASKGTKKISALLGQIWGRGGTEGEEGKKIPNERTWNKFIKEF